ncbi:hypothetical protein [Marispirochaeta sp.]|jgi:hypothetical protein|uniref:hypothetical protein n=1 Tax=Marispirochaeta sp. TaxID=2038653 RepID=UPI0029C64ACC|nr:hypothetical protein [Marispirochaeta sp.]
MKAVVYATKGNKSDLFSPDNMIIEIWLETLGICINEQHGIFRESTPRKAYKHFGTFNLSDEYCEIAREYLESRDFFQEQNAKVFTALKQKLKQ